MKAKFYYLPGLFIALALMINSCSTTQQFAGTYPKNNITGRGPGYGAVENKTQPVANTVAEVKPEAKCEETEAVEATPAPAAKHKGPSKFETKLTKFAMNYMAKHAPDFSNMTASSNTKSISGLREKLSSKIYNAVLKKYGYTATTSSSLESASRPMAIAALAAGCAAALWYAGFFFGAAAIVLGALALVGIKRGGDGRRGFAIAGIVLGAFFFFFWILWSAVFVLTFHIL